MQKKRSDAGRRHPYPPVQDDLTASRRAPPTLNGLIILSVQTWIEQDTPFRRPESWWLAFSTLPKPARMPSTCPIR